MRDFKRFSIRVRVFSGAHKRTCRLVQALRRKIILRLRLSHKSKMRRQSTPAILAAVASKAAKRIAQRKRRRPDSLQI